jgi:Uncharacterized BCR, YaiI/YqxD family COG1671
VAYRRWRDKREASRELTDIYVDGDACPVREETYRVAVRLRLNVFVVSNGSRPIRPPGLSNVSMVLVGDNADAADDWIAEHISSADVCVTSDIPLASLLRGDLDEKPAAIRMRIRRRGVGMIAGARLSRKPEPRAWLTRRDNQTLALIVACTGGRPGPRLRSRAARRR